MGYKEKVLEFLNGNRYTTRDLANLIGINESDVRVYLHKIQKKDKDKVKVVGTENKYKVYTLNNKEYENGSLKQQNDLIDRLTLLMIKARLISERYGITINENELEASIKRLEEAGKIG